MDKHGFTYMDHISDLPVFKAPEGVWDRLEVDMFTINNSALPVMSPSEAMWGKLEKRLVFRKRRIRMGIMALLFFGIIISGYQLYNHINTEPLSKLVDHEVGIKMTESIKPSSTTPKLSESVLSVSKQIRDDIKASDEKTAIDNVVTEMEANETEIDLIAQEGKHDELVLLKMETRNIKCISLKKRVNFQDRQDECSSFQGAAPELSWGPSYEYQFFFAGNKYINTEQEYWQSFNIKGKLCFGKFYLKSGLGITLVRDNTPWSYDYKQYELINTYEYVDSVHYDPVTGETTHYTSYVDVYDSVDHTANETIKKSYSYLNMPLFIGLQLYQRENWTFDISGGVIYNLLLSNNTTTININESDRRVTDVNFFETRRVKNLFTLGFQMNVERRLNDNISLYCYPSFKYYLNPMYQGDEEAQPMSIGLGVGLWFK